MTTRTANPAWDGALITSAMVLTGLGVVMNYSTTAALDIGSVYPDLALRHVGGVAAALLAAVVAARLPLAFWRRAALPFWLGTTGLLALTPWLGIEAGGAQRWLSVPGLPISLQPSEFARLATALAAAALLADAGPQRANSPRWLLGRCGLVVLPAALLLLQPDLSGTAMLCAATGLVLFAAGLTPRLLAVPAAAGAACAAIFIAVHPYARARVRGFLAPWQSADAEAFQVVQSFVAFGRGGSFGVGLGDGRQKLFYLPEAHTDFILSVVAEELGLAGVLLVIGAFAALCFAGLRVAQRAREPFALLAAVACTASVGLPALCNAAVVMGLLPTTGLALPFLSHGSNSLVCTAAAVGILLRIARDTEGAGARAPAGRAKRRRGRP